MNQDNFYVVKNTKLFIIDLDIILKTFPKNEKVLRDNIKKYSYDILSFCYEFNTLPIKYFVKERRLLEYKTLSLISMLNFYLEEAYRLGYISENNLKKKTRELTNIYTRLKELIKNEESNC